MTAVVLQFPEKRAARARIPRPLATQPLYERVTTMFNNANPTAQAGRENSAIAAQDSPGRPSTPLLSNSTSSLRKPAVKAFDVNRLTYGYRQKEDGTAESEQWGLDQLFQQYHDGELDPIPVALPIELIPEHFYGLRALGGFCAVAFGLSLAAFDTTDVPLSGLYVAGRMDWLVRGKPDGRRGWKGLNLVERYGVIALGAPRPDIQRFGRMCRTVRPPEPLASELGYEHYQPELTLVEPREEMAA